MSRRLIGVSLYDLAWGVGFGALSGAVILLLVGFGTARHMAEVDSFLKFSEVILQHIQSTEAPVADHHIEKIYEAIHKGLSNTSILGSAFHCVLAPSLVKGDIVRQPNKVLHHKRSDARLPLSEGKDRLRSLVNIGERSDFIVPLEIDGATLGVRFMTAASVNGINVGLVLFYESEKAARAEDGMIFRSIANSLDVFVRHLAGLVVEGIRQRGSLENESQTMSLLAVSLHELAGEMQVMQNTALQLHPLLAHTGSMDINTIEPAKDLLGRIIRGIAHSVYMIDNVRDLPTLAAGAYRLDTLTPRPLGPELDAVISQVQTAWPEVGLSVKGVRGEGPKVLADGSLGTIIRNLIFNAASFSPPGGMVTVTVSRQSGYVHIIVQDEGEGIPPEVRQQLFRYASMISSDKKRVRSEKVKHGAGVGLTMVAEIVRAYNGEIDCRTNDEVEGGWFEVKLPEAVEDSLRIGEDQGHVVFILGAENLSVGERLATKALREQMPGMFTRKTVSLCDVKSMVMHIAVTRAHWVVTEIPEALNVLRNQYPQLTLIGIGPPEAAQKYREATHFVAEDTEWGRVVEQIVMASD